MSLTEILEMILETLGMTFISCAFAYLFGLPTGVLLNVTSKKGIMPCKWLNTIFSLIINILRSIPCLIVVVSYGFVSRMVEQSLSEVDNGKIEAIESLGATKMQIIMKVLLPETKASLVSGLAVTLVSILGYTSFAYNISAGGLIARIWRYYATHTDDYLSQPIFWVMIIIVVLIVQGIQEAGLLIAKKLDKRRIL